MEKKTSKNSKRFSIVPATIFIISVIVYLIGTFLPWLLDKNIYGLVQPSDWPTNFVIPITVVMVILAIMQTVNCFVKQNWLRVTSGICGIIASIIPWLTFLGGTLLGAKYISVGVGAYISAVGAALVIISSIVLLATNKKKNTNY